MAGTPAPRYLGQKPSRGAHWGLTGISPGAIIDNEMEWPRKNFILDEVPGRQNSIDYLARRVAEARLEVVERNTKNI